MNQTTEEAPQRPSLEIEPYNIHQMEGAVRDRGGHAKWYAYRNDVMDSAAHENYVFLLVGRRCTHEEPPPHLPDGYYGAGWKYRLVGIVDVENNVLLPLPNKTVEPSEEAT